MLKQILILFLVEVCCENWRVSKLHMYALSLSLSVIYFFQYLPDKANIS